jgi:hypothetical protein
MVKRPHKSTVSEETMEVITTEYGQSHPTARMDLNMAPSAVTAIMKMCRQNGKESNGKCKKENCHNR